MATVKEFIRIFKYTHHGAADALGITTRTLSDFLNDKRKPTETTQLLIDALIREKDFSQPEEAKESNRSELQQKIYDMCVSEKMKILSNVTLESNTKELIKELQKIDSWIKYFQ